MPFIPAPRSLSSAIVLTVVACSALMTNDVHGQAAKPKDGKPAGVDTRPLARYVPKENIDVFLEWDGLEAHADFWKKTAAYRILNDTSVGAMLEKMVVQLGDKLIAIGNVQKLSGSDVLTIVKHSAKQGFVFAMVSDTVNSKPKLHMVIVFRGAYSIRESRPSFGRLMGYLMGTDKSMSTKKGGRTVVQVTAPDNGSWVWWPEQGDLVYAEHPEAILATIDGKMPSAVDNPIRAELFKADAAINPFGVLFIDPKTPITPKDKLAETFGKIFLDAGIDNVQFRWGFQDDAIVTQTRLKAPQPRKGLLTLFDQTPFDRTKLLPMPSSNESFTAFSVDSNKALDSVFNTLTTLPPWTETAKDAIGSLETKSRVDLRKDLLARLGPKMLVYVMPGTSTRAAEPENSANTAALSNPLLTMLKANMPGLGTAPVPRYALIAEMKDFKGMESTLETLMVALNKTMRAQAAEAAKAAEAAANADGGPGAGPGRIGRPGGGRGGFGEGGTGPGGRRPPPAPAAPEFKPMPGTDKIYVFTVPADQAKAYPPGFRPTIRLADKFLVIAATPEVARLAVEAKTTEFTPTADLAKALDPLPKELICLDVQDPREKQPELLATLPALIQEFANAAIALKSPLPTTTKPGSGGPGGGPGASGRPGFAAAGPAGGMPDSDEKRGGGGRGAMSRPGAAGGPVGAGAPPGFIASGPGGQRPPGTGGPGDSTSSASTKPDGSKTSPFYFDIDAGLLPSPEDIKANLFPSTLVITTSNQDVWIQSRTAFPNPISKEALTMLAVGMRIRRTLNEQAAGVANGATAAGGLPPGFPGAMPGGGPPGGAGRGPAGAGGRPGPGNSGGGLKSAEP